MVFVLPHLFINLVVMSEKITGIILNVRPYNDKNCIVTLYTRSRGRLSFISPLGSGKASNARRARLRPLSVISTELNFKPTVELQRLGSVTLSEVWCDIYFHPVKRSIALFISEFLYKLLNASMPDEHLFDFLTDSLRLLDRSVSGVNNFHIALLVSLLSFSGIQPDVSGYKSGKVFSFHSGTFLRREEVDGPFISEEDAAGVAFTMRLNFANIKRLRLTNANRRLILNGLLNYYSYHFPGISTLKSLEVLRELF